MNSPDPRNDAPIPAPPKTKSCEKHININNNSIIINLHIFFFSIFRFLEIISFLPTYLMCYLTRYLARNGNLKFCTLLNSRHWLQTAICKDANISAKNDQRSYSEFAIFFTSLFIRPILLLQSPTKRISAPNLFFSMSIFLQ